MAVSLPTAPRPCERRSVRFTGGRTGIANGILYADIFEPNRLIVTQTPALILEGPVQIQAGVIHVKVERIEPLGSHHLPGQATHDFH